MAVSLWRLAFKYMRRSNLFWSLEKGDVGVVNVQLKLIVQRFLYFGDHPDPLFRAALQRLGSVHLIRWLATSEGLNYGVSHTAFYKEVIVSLVTLGEQSSWEYLITAKPRRLYWFSWRKSYRRLFIGNLPRARQA
ncbi:hypothetical protein HPB48_008743 [Haemaphysalis longicornis]|uniref:Uncharacterized protein n=1 Tax=Haemaphysalis longicornis TaxID=44386 RepID=A0A9J6G7F6_HAELO|nr:hypothetical protein HPB48_008743 [Haemaphysalis longicornis]